ncbi:MAG: DNA-directed RNA polymerase subunit alpha [Candidatus Hydrothermales bacterium]
MYRLTLTVPEGIKILNLSERKGFFEISPLERGYGITLGNSLRRVLLSSIKGSAIFAVHIDGVLHEFSTIEGVTEDVPHIVLNLKKVRVKFESDLPYKSMVLSKQGKGVVKASDFRLPPEIKIMNPDQHIAELSSDDSKIAIEAFVTSGRGYLTVEEIKYLIKSDKGFQPILPHNSFFIDADFSPVRFVNFSIENMRVDYRTDFERLLIEIETDGSVSPYDALVEAHTIMINHLSCIKKILTPKVEIQQDKKPKEVSKRVLDILEENIAFLDLSKRVTEALEEAGIKTLYDLVSLKRDDLLKIKNLGKKSIEEIEEKLRKFDLYLGMELPKTSKG